MGKSSKDKRVCLKCALFTCPDIPSTGYILQKGKRRRIQSSFSLQASSNRWNVHYFWRCVNPWDILSYFQHKLFSPLSRRKTSCGLVCCTWQLESSSQSKDMASWKRVCLFMLLSLALHPIHKSDQRSRGENSRCWSSGHVSSRGSHSDKGGHHTTINSRKNYLSLLGQICRFSSLWWSSWWY